MAERFYSGLRTQNRDQPSSGLPVSLPGLTPTRARNTPTRRESRQESVKEIDHVQLLRAYTELQKQNNGLLVLTAKMTQEMQCLRRETQDVKDMIMNKGCNGKEAQNESAETKKLPKDLTRKVRQLHSEQREKFKGDERFTTDYNRRIAATLYTQLVEHFRGRLENQGDNAENSNEPLKYSEWQITRAIRRHHETKRKAYLDSMPARQQQVMKNKAKAKKKQMRSRLYSRRFKAVQTEEERTAWMQICDIYMTEESDDEDEGVVRRHQLSWASDELQELKATLDQRLIDAEPISGRFRLKPRVDGALSTLSPPLQPVEWAVVGDDYEGRRDIDDRDLGTATADSINLFNCSGSGYTNQQSLLDMMTSSPE